MTFQSGDYLDPVVYLRKFEIDMRSSNTQSVSGTGAAANAAGQSGFFTPIRVKTGSTTTGSASTRYGFPGSFGNGNIWVHTGVTVFVLSTVTEEFIFEAGLHDGRGTSAIANGVFFRYDRLTSLNWLAVTESTTTETVTDTGVAVTTDPVTLHFHINADGTSITFYKNNVALATHTTNISLFNTLSVNFLITKSAGTTSREVSCDFFQYMNKRVL